MSKRDPDQKSIKSGKSGKSGQSGQSDKHKSGPCPRPCTLIPTNVPAPKEAQEVLHPKKDVFVLKVAKVGANGDRICKMELELVTPKGPEKKALVRIDTKDTQCEPEPPPCCCANACYKKKK